MPRELYRRHGAITATPGHRDALLAILPEAAAGAEFHPVGGFGV